MGCGGQDGRVVRTFTTHAKDVGSSPRRAGVYEKISRRYFLKSLILWVGRIKRLVFSDKDEKLGGPVCTLRTLKTPWQLKIEGRVGDTCRLPGQNSKLKSHPKLATLSQYNINEYLRNRNEAAREARGTTIP